MHPLALLFILAALLRFVVEQGLACLNLRHARRHRDALPPALAPHFSPVQLDRGLSYLGARVRFDATADLLWLLFAGTCALSGALPAADRLFRDQLALPPFVAGLALMAAFALLQEMVSLPLDWYDTFRVEARFGFNRTTVRTFWLDALKGLVLKTLLGLPLAAGALALIAAQPHGWWLPAAALVVGVQVLVLWLYPRFIAPWFNHFTPLPEGPLRTRLEALAVATRFPVGQVLVMDGSRRSGHSNAYFTGFGRHRRLVLYDTLVQGLSDTQLAAVLAHEIGHWRRRHIPRLLGLMAGLVVAGAYGASVLLRWPPFLDAFGLTVGHAAPALVLLGLAAGPLLFWIAPLLHALQRRFEYQADAFAARATGAPEALASALLCLADRNLENPCPHPWYSAYHHAHPALAERLLALHWETR